MKIIIKKENLAQQAEQVVRLAGYGLIYDQRREVQSFVRHFGRGRYPRFHMYVSEDREGRVVFDLHLDQKEASYAGAHMHNAEYDGELVEGEINRLKALISKLYRERQLTINN